MSNHTQLPDASDQSRRSHVGNWPDPAGRATGNWPNPQRPGQPPLGFMIQIG